MIEVPILRETTPSTGRDYCYVEVGDLVLIPVKDRFVLGVCSCVSPVVVAWEDMCVVTGRDQGITAKRNLLLPSAGVLIGASFASFEDADDAMNPHWRKATS